MVCLWDRRAEFVPCLAAVVVAMAMFSSSCWCGCSSRCCSVVGREPKGVRSRFRAGGSMVVNMVVF